MTEHGQLFTWGCSSHGQTGHSTRGVIATPTRVASVAWEGRAAKEAPRPVVVSAEEEGGRTFHLKGQPGTPLQAMLSQAWSVHERSVLLSPCTILTTATRTAGSMPGVWLLPHRGLHRGRGALRMGQER